MQGNGTPESPYLVATAADLDSIRNLPPDAHYRQIADINLGGTPWTPLLPGSYGFMGVYDGGGHKITGLYVYSDSGSNPAGLFGRVAHNADQVVEVKNLSVYGKVEAAGYAGFIAGYVGYGTYNVIKITNCHVVGEIDCVGGCYAGGVYGMNSSMNGDKGDVLVDNCIAHINIRTTHGANWGFIGGLVGNLCGSEHGTVKLSNCAAYGKIAVSPYAYQGGLVGTVQVYKSYIENCEAHVEIDGGQDVGGLVGSAQNTVFVSSCVATGKISNCWGSSGGLVGRLGSDASVLRDSYATGDISTDGGGYYYYYGGLCGSNFGGTIQNCYASGNVNARNGVGGLCGYNNGNILSSFALSKAIVDNAPDYYPASRIASDQRGTISAYARSDMTYNGVVGGFPDFDPTINGKDGQNITPEQTKMRATYAAAGWDMSVWDIVEGHTYPYLKSERNKIFVKQNGKICRVRIPYAKVGDPKPCQTYVKQDGKIYRV